MPPSLDLVPTIDDQSIEAYRAHVEALRARRMVAAVEYFEGQKQKFEKRTDVLARKLVQQYTMLAKEIGSADRALAKLDLRLVNVDGLKAEMGLTRDVALILAPEDDPE